MWHTNIYQVHSSIINIRIMSKPQYAVQGWTPASVVHVGAGVSKYIRACGKQKQKATTFNFNKGSLASYALSTHKSAAIVTEMENPEVCLNGRVEPFITFGIIAEGMPHTDLEKMRYRFKHACCSVAIAGTVNITYLPAKRKHLHPQIKRIKDVKIGDTLYVFCSPEHHQSDSTAASPDTAISDKTDNYLYPFAITLKKPTSVDTANTLRPSYLSKNLAPIATVANVDPKGNCVYAILQPEWTRVYRESNAHSAQNTQMLETATYGVSSTDNEATLNPADNDAFNEEDQEGMY